MNPWGCVHLFTLPFAAEYRYKITPVSSIAGMQIAALLADVGAGSFTARRTAAADDLVLAVKGVGPLGLPISRRQAQLLLRSARPARGLLTTLLAAPMRAPGDWSIALPAGCKCALCRRLGAFLADPAQPRLEWPLAKPGRQHMHQRIDSHELPVRHETRRSGSPYTLVLEKTTRLFDQEAAARHGWQADLDWLASAGWPDAALGAHCTTS